MLGGGWALAGIAGPNKSVKGTRRPLAVLKFCFYQGSVASLKPTEGGCAPLTVTLGVLLENFVAERPKAGSNEKLFVELLQQKIAGISLSGKQRFTLDNVEISADQSLTHNGISYLIEIDSANMAKLLVGQYVLINQLYANPKENAFFLVVHTYKDYNPERTIKNLSLINKQLYSGAGIKFT